MSDLVEFLRARLDEDEAEARTCAEMFPSPWEVSDRGWRVRIYAAEVPETGDHAEPGWVRYPVVMEVEPDRNLDDPLWLSERVEHIARHDPARVLREVEAKRRIVHELTTERHIRKATDRRGVYENVVEAELLDSWEAEVTVKALAAIYSDHPDYRDEWKP